jgi:hypothetical protein
MHGTEAKGSPVPLLELVYEALSKGHGTGWNGRRNDCRIGREILMEAVVACLNYYPTVCLEELKQLGKSCCHHVDDPMLFFYYLIHKLFTT